MMALTCSEKVGSDDVSMEGRFPTAIGAAAYGWTDFPFV